MILGADESSAAPRPVFGGADESKKYNISWKECEMSGALLPSGRCLAALTSLKIQQKLETVRNIEVQNQV